mmetsp:Transcript_58396/g.115770  ORF Transcript_58396/g.115770 Transcript_58396/m.115770 type:complete len:222 (+) Transcript_58396:416-1081(+)
MRKGIVAHRVQTYLHKKRLLAVYASRSAMLAIRTEEYFSQGALLLSRSGPCLQHGVVAQTFEPMVARLLQLHARSCARESWTLQHAVPVAPWRQFVWSHIRYYTQTCHPLQCSMMSSRIEGPQHWCCGRASTRPSPALVVVQAVMPAVRGMATVVAACSCPRAELQVSGQAPAHLVKALAGSTWPEQIAARCWCAFPASMTKNYVECYDRPPSMLRWQLHC